MQNFFADDIPILPEDHNVKTSAKELNDELKKS